MQHFYIQYIRFGITLMFEMFLPFKCFSLLSEKGFSRIMDVKVESN